MSAEGVRGEPMSAEGLRALRLDVTGVVQGVGFRPFVYNLARSHGLTGWVNNDSRGVTIVVEGPEPALSEFAADVSRKAPPLAVVESVVSRPLAPEGFADFTIRASTALEGERTLVSPDTSTCEECAAEVGDPSDRRYRYPFTNCTNCGPRFTIIEDVPYDRPMTTMRDFPMCEECAAEYADPANRRFHAQPNACPVCGPRLFLNVPGRDTGFEWDASCDVTPRPHQDAAVSAARTDAVIAAAVELLRSGAILAIKGLGGFHLACDATNEDAVRLLRERKRRWGKPFAVMFPSLEDARCCCVIDPEEAALLEGAVRPIVLLRLDGDSPSGGPPRVAVPLAPSVAPGLAEFGVMLPYTPLHRVLLGDMGRPLVMTSGNVSDEPIAMDNEEALLRLAPLADAFLLHDRGIFVRYDDSVVRVVDGRTEMVRRARGYAPFPLKLPVPARVPILAAGPEQKNTFCLASGEYAFVSQHIGDMENAETLEHYERTLALYERMFRITPELVAYDLHPEYLSTKFALSLGLPSVGVQHHHAHVAGVAAEHGIATPVVGVAFDGTGYGTDGTIWGGEFLVSTWAGFERVAHLATAPMPGGAASIRRPARMALGLLLHTDKGLLSHPGFRYLQERLATEELATVSTMVLRGLNSPFTSSMGRLFDAVAALTGVRDDAHYEGQAAIELEACADTSTDGTYSFDTREEDGGSPTVIEYEPVLRAILDDLAAGAGAPAISMRFHRAVIDVTVEVAARAAADAGTRHVALSGGVFMNRILLAGVMRGLESRGLTPLIHRDLPVNDGGISYGQAVIANATADAV
jgi:hydrogenase maturation protein HypF